METGNVVTNISHSICLAFFAAFVDYDNGMLWIAATPNDRGENKTLSHPYAPPHIHNSSDCGRYDTGRWECGVYVFNSLYLVAWERTKTDIVWSGPNIDIARVHPSKNCPAPPNLPKHRYVMATEN